MSVEGLGNYHIAQGIFLSTRRCNNIQPFFSLSSLVCSVESVVENVTLLMATASLQNGVASFFMVLLLYSRAYTEPEIKQNESTINRYICWLLLCVCYDHALPCIT